MFKAIEGKSQCWLRRYGFGLVVISGLGLGSAESGAFGKVQAHQSYWVEEIANGLRFPSAVAWLPNGDAVIAERQGGLRRIRAGALDPSPIEGTPASVQDLLNGIKDIALDPDFKTNHVIYILIAEGTAASHYAAVYRATFEGHSLRDVQRIFRSTEQTHSGPVAGRLLFLSDKTLLVTLPVSGATHEGPAQALDSYIGKIIRIQRDGAPAPDNPFAGLPDALPEIWSVGHRVPMGLFQDPTDGAIWEVEAGPRGGDELNRLTAGGNYGWPKASWGFNYSGDSVAPAQTGADIEDPVAVWTPSITPSSIVRYQGNVLSPWKGDYFIGSLTGKALLRLRMAEGQVVLQERLLIDLNERIREISIGPDYHLYLLTDHRHGRLLRINPGEPPKAAKVRVAQRLQEPAFSDASPVPGNVALGKEIFRQSCSACHAVGATMAGGAVGPDLTGVFGRKAGTVPGFSFSSAMTSSQRTWDGRSLNAFLSSPAAFVPGTTMTAAPVTDAEARSHIIEFLEQSVR